MEAIGRTIWAIPEGYIPGDSTGPAPEMLCHEPACILNTGDHDAHLKMYVFFEDREPAGPYDITVSARRTRHLRFNELTVPEPIRKGTDYSSVFISDLPVVIQHTRLDSRQAANALLSTIAFGGDR